MFTIIFQIYSKIPFVVTFASGILNQIIQVLSDEINFLFITTLYILVIYKHTVFLNNEEAAVEFDSTFVEVINKLNELSEKYKKFRFDTKSKLSLYLLPSNISDYLRFLHQNLKSRSSNLSQFNVKNFLSYTKEINGIKMHSSYGKINEDINRILIGENNVKLDFSVFNGLREQMNRHYDFTQFEKFNFFRYNDNAKSNEFCNPLEDNSPKKYIRYNKRGSTKQNTHCRPSIPTPQINQNPRRNVNNQSNNNLLSLYNSNNVTVHSRKHSSDINYDETLPKTSIQHNRKTSSDNRVRQREDQNNIAPIQDFASVLNEIFVSTSKKNPTMTEKQFEIKQIPEKKDDNNDNQGLPKYDSEKFKNILQEMDKLYKDIDNDDASEKLPKKNTYSEKTDLKIDELIHQSYRSNTSKINPKVDAIRTNTIVSNNQDNILINTKTIIEKDVFNYFKNNDPEQGNNEPNRTEVANNINIYNIHNNIHVEENLDLEKIANSFLYQELSKTSLHWLISSKDIQIEQKIGFGGSSEVFQANYRGTDVAVKKIKILEVKEENLKEFKREVSSLIMLRHPNLVLFMGAIAEKDNLCIVTEYCAGGTLFSILHQRKDLVVTWELRLRILLEIAVGINFLHTNNPPIIHRDLKSLNILLTEKIEKPTDNTKVKISDFGLSKIIKNFDSGRDKMTGQLGTCHWMAPEVIDNKEYTLKADVYSYGIIIWEICARKTPYNDMNQTQISYFVTVKKGRPDQTMLPPNTPKPLIKLMQCCWDEDPNKRPSFSQIIQYLKKMTI